MNVVEAIFWVAASLIGYTLIGYPLLSLLLAATVRRRCRKGPIEPKVSMIIAAYNEEEVIAEKLEQTLALDYPPDRLEVIVASDGSTDRTDEIVRSFADRGVVLYQSGGRKGKTGTVNGAVGVATGDILVFSDATGIYNARSLRELVANFNDPAIGCVTGRVAYRYGDDATSQGFRGYQRFAVAVRRAESRWGSQTSVSGSIHALRRELFRPADPAFSLDVIDAVHAVAQGYRVVYENEAVSLEQSRRSIRDEFRCRVRIGVRATSMVPYVAAQLIRSGRYTYLFQMVSHKFLRWWLWLFLAAALMSNAVLAGWSPWYFWLAVAQAAGYAAGIAGLAAEGARRALPGLATAGFFVMANAAMCVGSVRGLRGVRMAKWEPVR